jgi:hypothetical protein
LTNTTTYPVARFFPIVINAADTIQTGLYRHYFSVDMPSQGGGVAYNDQWISGWVQAGGWSDQQPRMFQFAHGYFDTLERSILGVYVGNSVAVSQVVVYLRGGGTYYIRTDSSSVIAYSTAYSVTEVGNTNTFAIKDVNGADVVGTSTGISQLFFGVTSSNGTYTSGVNVVQNVNSTYTTPATTGSYASDAAVINRISGGDIVLDTGMTSSGPVWLQARRFSNFADKFALLLNPNGGNVGIGTTSPSYPLHVSGSVGSGSLFGRYISSASTSLNSATTVWNLSIFASNDIGATGNIISLSDRRAKVPEEPPSESYLNLVDKIQVRQFSWIDKIEKGSTKKIGFFAQEVEEVVPDAVGCVTEVIPTIYRQANAFTETTVTIQGHGITTEKKLEVVDSENGKTKIDIIRVIDADNLEVKFEKVPKDKLFIVGPEVDDSRMVNHDYLMAVGFGGLKELHEIVKKQQDLIVALEARLAALESKLTTPSA